MTQTQTKAANPWEQREIKLARHFQSRDAFGKPTEALDLDSAYKDPRYSETRKCPQGHTAYRKASVGTFVCPTCGSLLAANGQWTAARY